MAIFISILCNTIIIKLKDRSFSWIYRLQPIQITTHFQSWVPHILTLSSLSRHRIMNMRVNGNLLHHSYTFHRRPSLLQSPIAAAAASSRHNSSCFSGWSPLYNRFLRKNKSKRTNREKIKKVWFLLIEFILYFRFGFVKLPFSSRLGWVLFVFLLTKFLCNFCVGLLYCVE